MTSGTNSGPSDYQLYYYDPQVEFLELGINSNGGRAWRIYGPDTSGVYGGAGGVGGIEAFVDETSGYVTGQVNNRFGDTIGFMWWYYGLLYSSSYAQALGGYGPEPGTYLYSSINGYPMPQWRGSYPDLTGFISMGARYYEPRSGRFLSPDPLGHDASLSLYDYCGGDPVNGLDPDGRFDRQGNSTILDGQSDQMTTSSLNLDVPTDPSRMENTYAPDEQPDDAELLAEQIENQQYLLGAFGRPYAVDPHPMTGEQQLGELLFALPMIMEPEFAPLELGAARLGFTAEQLEFNFASENLFGKLSSWDIPAAETTTAAKTGPLVQGEFDFVNGDLSGKLSGSITSIGWTGKIGQSNLANLGGVTQQFFDTPFGARFTDQFANGIMNESKVGYQALTESNMIQIVKDNWIVQNNQQVDAAIWHFYRSPITGKVGPSGPLEELLNAYNIPMVLHY